MEGPLKALARSALNIWSEFDWFKTSAGKRGYAHGTDEKKKIRRKEKKARRMDGQLVARRRRIPSSWTAKWCPTKQLSCPGHSIILLLVYQPSEFVLKSSLSLLFDLAPFFLRAVESK